MTTPAFPRRTKTLPPAQKIGSGAGGVTFDTVSETNNPTSDIDAQNLAPTGTAGPNYVCRRPRPVPADRGRRRSEPRRQPVIWEPSSVAPANTSAVPGSAIPSTAAGSIGYGDVSGAAVWNPNDYTGIVEPRLSAVGLSHLKRRGPVGGDGHEPAWRADQCRRQLVDALQQYATSIRPLR